MIVRNQTIIGLLIFAFGRVGLDDVLEYIFQETRGNICDIEVWTAMIGAYGDNGKAHRDGIVCVF